MDCWKCSVCLINLRFSAPSGWAGAEPVRADPHAVLRTPGLHGTCPSFRLLQDHCDWTPPDVYVVVWQIRTLAVQAMNLVIVLKPTQLALSMEGFIQVRQPLGPTV